MSIIFADDINDNRGEDLSKRVDTIYDYIAYMKEQLEFWARNRTKEISSADAKIAAAVEDIAENAENIAENTEAIGENTEAIAENTEAIGENTEAIAENTEAIADLEPRIQVYENNLPVSGTSITAHKPLKFDYANGYLDLLRTTFTSSVNLNNITYTCEAWCNNVTGRPSYSGTYGFFLSFGLMQQYWEYHATGFTPFVRAYTNNKWYPWRCLIENDWHSDGAVWDNSNDLLNLTKDRNGRYMEVQQTSSSKPANNPFGSVTAIYYRHQILSYTGSAISYAMVELREVYPVPGRIWTNVYNVDSWSGWKKLTPS